jgi:hypothetical protein
MSWCACTCHVEGNLCRECCDGEGLFMLERITATIRARAEGRNEGGDSTIMELIDKIVENSLQSSQHLDSLIKSPTAKENAND